MQKDVDILAITIASGNTALDNGAINTKLALDKLFYNKTYPPIYLGAETSLSKHKDFYPFFNIDGLGGAHETLFKTEVNNIRETFLKEIKSAPHAASKIVELVNNHPNEVTIIALAPLTNLALALKLSHDPVQFTKNIKKLVIMGGNEPKEFSNEPFVDRVLNYPEFNFKYDAIAAKIVFDQFLCPITVYTYDCCLRAFDLETDVLIEEFEKYIQKSKRCHFLERIGIPHRLACIIPRVFYCCDLVTVIGLFHETYCEAVFKNIKSASVQANNSKLDGLIIQQKEPTEMINENIELCVTMNSRNVFDIFKSYLDKLKMMDETE